MLKIVCKDFEYILLECLQAALPPYANQQKPKKRRLVICKLGFQPRRAYNNKLSLFFTSIRCSLEKDQTPEKRNMIYLYM